MTRNALPLLLAATLVAWPATAPAQGADATPDSLAARIDRAVGIPSTPGTPGCAVGVYSSGRVLFAKGYGYANLEYAAPITPSTPFIVGSVSKQFTAAVIALLAQQKKLSLDDDIHRFVPELPDYGRPITIRQLVHHESGLRDFWELVGLAGMRYDDGYTPEDVLALTRKQHKLNFPPGQRYMYSNTGYILLGLVVKRASGKSLREFADEEIFKPLGMTRTHFHDDHTMLVADRARSYESTGEMRWRLADWNNDLVGQGGLMTTVEDLAKWDANFETGRVGGPALPAQQLERGRLNDGSTTTYAFGLTIGDFRGLGTVEHGGSSGGYRAQITRFPSAHTTVTALCNATNAPAGRVVERVAEVVLEKELGAHVAAGTAAVGPRPQGGEAALQLSAAERNRFAGRYYSEELEATYEIATDQGAIVLRRPRAPADTLRAIDARTLRGRVGTLRFDAGGKGGAPAFVLEAGRVQDVRFQRR